MTIALVVDSYNDRSNGTSMTAFRFASELVRRGHEVRVVCTGSGSKEGPCGERLYFVRERYIPIVTEVSRRQHMVFGYPDLEVLEAAFSGCDLAHFYLPFALEIAGVHLCRRMGLPYIGAFHVQPQHISYNMFLNFDWFNNYLFARFYKAFYRYIHHIHCPSKLMEEEIERAGYGGKKYVISNGFRLSNTESKPKPKSDSLFHIISVGRFSKEKRQDVLIRALALSRHARQLKLHLHGIGPREQNLRNLCDRFLCNPPELGFIDNVLLIEKLKSADLYVHAAQVESEAISCLEAVSVGTVPVIADSVVSATTQFALDSRSLFKTNDPKSLSEKIDYWIDHAEELDRMRAQYAKSALKYSMDVSIEKILAVYDEAIADFRRNPSLFETINP